MSPAQGLKDYLVSPKRPVYRDEYSHSCTSDKTLNESDDEQPESLSNATNRPSQRQLLNNYQAMHSNDYSLAIFNYEQHQPWEQIYEKGKEKGEDEKQQQLQQDCEQQLAKLQQEQKQKLEQVQQLETQLGWQKRREKKVEQEKQQQLQKDQDREQQLATLQLEREQIMEKYHRLEAQFQQQQQFHERQMEKQKQDYEQQLAQAQKRCDKQQQQHGFSRCNPTVPLSSKFKSYAEDSDSDQWSCDLTLSPTTLSLLFSTSASDIASTSSVPANNNQSPLGPPGRSTLRQTQVKPSDPTSNSKRLGQPGPSTLRQTPVKPSAAARIIRSGDSLRPPRSITTTTTILPAASWSSSSSGDNGYGTPVGLEEEFMQQQSTTSSNEKTPSGQLQGFKSAKEQYHYIRNTLVEARLKYKMEQQRRGLSPSPLTLPPPSTTTEDGKQKQHYDDTNQGDADILDVLASLQRYTSGDSTSDSKQFDDEKYDSPSHQLFPITSKLTRIKGNKTSKSNGKALLLEKKASHSTDKYEQDQSDSGLSTPNRLGRSTAPHDSQPMNWDTRNTADNDQDLTDNDDSGNLADNENSGGNNSDSTPDYSHHHHHIDISKVPRHRLSNLEIKSIAETPKYKTGLESMNRYYLPTRQPPVMIDSSNNNISSSPSDGSHSHYSNARSSPPPDSPPTTGTRMTIGQKSAAKDDIANTTSEMPPTDIVLDLSKFNLTLDIQLQIVRQASRHGERMKDWPLDDEPVTITLRSGTAVPIHAYLLY